MVHHTKVLSYIQVIIREGSVWTIMVYCEGEGIVVNDITDGALMDFIIQAVVEMKYGSWRVEYVSLFKKEFRYDIEEEIYNSYVVLRPPAVKRNEKTKSANKN